MGRRLVTVTEPVDDWSDPIDEDGNGILQLYYMDKKKYGLLFQSTVLNSRVSQLFATRKKHGNDAIILSERSPASGGIFAKQMVVEGSLTPLELKLHGKWLRDKEEIVPTTAIIYLRSTPNLCKERCDTRNRKGEDLISMDLLESLHDHHETYIDEKKGLVPVLVLDASLPTGSHVEKIAEFLESLCRTLSNATEPKTYEPSLRINIGWEDDTLEPEFKKCLEYVS
jgi:deoxyadenosine/deoxycytidine kinase